MKNKLAIKSIEFYQTHKITNKKHCRYCPTCSEYGLEAFKRYNFFKAFFLTLGRILRCNPLFKGGYDPVPEKKPKLFKLLDHVYILPSTKNTDRPNIGYIEGENESILIDATNSYKHLGLLKKELKRENLRIPTKCILTHYHWDHVWGADGSFELISNKKTKEHVDIERTYDFSKKNYDNNFSDDKIPLFCKFHIKKEYGNTNNIKIPEINTTFDTEYELDLGNDYLKAFLFPSIHTDDSTAIYLKKSKVLFIGDALCGKINGVDFIDDKNIIKEQIRLLESMDISYVVLGHGEIMSKDDMIKELKESLTE